MPYKDPEDQRKCELRWYYNHPEVKEERRKYALRHRKELREKIFKALGDKCANPYNLNHGDFANDSRCLQIDHVHGGGCIERKQFGIKEAYYRNILKQIESGSKDYQLLCANCNWIKARIGHA